MSILIPIDNYPIPYHPTWSIWDASLTMDFMKCQRLALFKKLFAWSHRKPSVHLLFGTAWHAMMEEILLNGYNEVGINKGYNRFIKIYREFYDEDQDEFQAPKNPACAKKALETYMREYFTDDIKVFGTEIGGEVPINATDSMAFKIDAIIQEKGKYYVWDHKTTGWAFTPLYDIQWDLRLQFQLYIHAFHAYLATKGIRPEELGGLVVNSVLLKMLKAGLKTEVSRYLVPFDLEMQSAFLQELNIWIAIIKLQFELLQNAKISDSSLSAFPRSFTGSACTEYNRECLFHSICMNYPNPLQIFEANPYDFHIKHWNPLEQEGIREKVEL